MLLLLSCGRDQATGPNGAPGGVARGLSFNAVFPQLANNKAFASFIDFDRVRVLFHHANGTVALDTLVAFPAGADTVTLSFDVRLAPGTPAAGEVLSLKLAYVNPKGDTVFRGVPVDLRAAAAVQGAPRPSPVTIPVVYTGPGAGAQKIRITPRTLTVNANAPFAFTGAATDAAGAAVPDAPIVWVTPDLTLATIPVPTAGAGTANAARGTARIIAQLINGAADTVTLTVIAVPTSIVAVSADNQVGVIGKPSPQPLAQPIAVRVNAADGLGVVGVSVTFAASDGGTVSPGIVVTDSAGLAQATWSLGVAAPAQTATAAVAGLTGSPVTFNATGVAKLNMEYTSIVLGAGQYEEYPYVSVPSVLSVPLSVTLTNSDTTIATTVPSITIPAVSYSVSARFDVVGRAPGSEQVTASAPGWTSSAPLAVTVTTPKLNVCCSNPLNSASLAQSLAIYSADSMGRVHTRQNSLAVRITSSDTTVLKVMDTLTTMPAGQNYTTSARVIPNGVGGTAWIYVSAVGHSPDSVKFTIVGPELTFGYTTRTLGVGQIEPNGYVQIPNAISKPLVVTLTNSDSTIAATEATITIPAGSSSAFFSLRGRGAGTNTIIASAPGYIPDTTASVVTTPRIRLLGASALNAYTLYTTNVYAEDSLGTVHNRLADLPVSLRSSDTTVLKVDTLVVIPAGSYYVPGGGQVPVGVRLTAVSPGTATIYVTAPGHLPDSVTWTVAPARVMLGWEQVVVGARQRTEQSINVHLLDPRDVNVTVTLRHTNAAAVALSDTAPIIYLYRQYQWFKLAGLLPGIDTVIATAPGYVADTAVVRVSSPYLKIGSAPRSGNTSSANATVRVDVADSTLSSHSPTDTVVVHAVSSDTTVIKPIAAYFHLSSWDEPSTGFQYVGPGTATITYSDSGGSAIPYRSTTTDTITVTGPSLAIAGAASGMLGTHQHTSVGSYYVYLPNAIGAPLKVALVSTDPRVATVPDTIVVPAGSYYTYFTITAQDTIGTVQIQATAVGYTPASVNMEVTKPKFLVTTTNSLYTTAPRASISVSAADANGNAHLVNSDVVVSLESSAPGVASIDSTTVTIVKDNWIYSNVAHWTPGAVGTARLSASDARAIRYPYTTGTADVRVTMPPTYMFASMSLGLGQYFDPDVRLPYAPQADVTVPVTHAARPTTLTPSSITISKNNIVRFKVQSTDIGVDTITASPPGHIPAIGVVSVGIGVISPLSGWPISLAVGDSVLVRLYTRGPDGSSQHQVKDATTFTLVSDANIKFVSNGSTITSVVVAADQDQTAFYVKGVAAGTANAAISNANYVTYTNIVTVNP